VPDEPALDGVAVVGLACRFPGAPNAAAFWQNLRVGVDSIARFTEEELLANGVPAEVLANPRYVPAHGALDEVDRFDGGLFGYVPRESALLDPQQRLFLECAWEALEHAGYDPTGVPGRAGVFAGVSPSLYGLRNLAHGGREGGSLDMFQVGLATDKDFLTTRVSYKLDLRGPSMAVQTACSTSLVAVHMACQSLLLEQSDVALAGGSSVAPHRRGYVYEPGGVVSADGKCRAFDASAGGTVPGSGVGVVVLKRLEDALRDRDSIWAVIRGSAVNNDGAGKVGFVAPSVEGQAEVIAEAQAVAGVEPGTIGYVEAHGTGTALGDPIEIRALRQAFGDSGVAHCAIGSVKTNLGHLDAAAGVAGLIKTVLALRYGLLPPSLHFERPNPACELEGSPFFVNTRLREWRSPGPRRAGVSSFGMGGTNAHVVLEEAPPVEPSSPARPGELLLLSARSEAALERARDRLREHLEAEPDLSLADAAHTLRAGRHAFELRWALACEDRDDALRALADGAGLRGRAPDARPPLVFLFPGQGAQHQGMGRGLYEHEPAFRSRVDRCSRLLGLDLDEAWQGQPAQFVTEYALAGTLMSWGLRPHALAGHSLGEYVAACLAGVMDLETALRLVAVRGRLMEEAPRGAMLGVGLGPEELEALLPAGVELAAVNAPGVCVASGAEAGISELAERLRRERVATRRLQTSHAFHSALVEPVVERFVEEVARVELRPPRERCLSGVSGDWLSAEDATDPAYWGRQMRLPVRWARGMERLLEDPRAVLIEVGPQATLSGLVRQQPGGRERLAVATMRRAEQARSDRSALLEGLGRLWTAGVAVDWDAYAGEERRRRVPMPTYPFERRRYWFNAPAQRAHGEPAWRSSPGGPGRPAAQAARWVVRSGGHELGPELARGLAAAGHDVRLDPEPGDGEADAIVDCTLLLSGAPPLLPAPARRLVVLTSGAQDLLGTERPAPWAVEALRELPARAQLIDLDPDAPAPVPALIGELLAPPADRSIAYRGANRRWVREQPWPAPALDGEAPALEAERDGWRSEPYVAPRTEVERRMAAVWAEQFGIADVGVQDNFFSLGGHSLLAVQLVAATRDRMGIEIEVATLFEHPTIAGLAGAIGEPPDEVALLAAEIERLTPEEAEAMLRAVGAADE
jgi:phthiocerol/phenolphthiocerol synthesis type-I polyketide synthase E